MALASPIHRLLDALGDGSIIRRVVSASLSVIGAVVLIAGLIGVFLALGVTFKLAATPDVMIGNLLYTLVVGASSFSIFEILRYRAASVRDLGASTFTVIPVVSIILRTTGEAYAVVLVAIGLSGFILNLFSASLLSSLGLGLFSYGPMMPSLPGSGAVGLIGGLTLLGGSLLGAFAFVLLFYFLAESVLIVADIARNVDIIAKTKIGLVPAVASATPMPAISSPAPPQAQAAMNPTTVAPTPKALPPEPRCPGCSALIEPGSSFCLNCGTRLVAR